MIGKGGEQNRSLSFDPLSSSTIAATVQYIQGEHKGG